MAEITVLLSAYREPLDQFQQALQSVVFQTWAAKQIIVVDDSGDARFAQPCEAMQKSIPAALGVALEYVANPRNLGLVASLNLGAGLARGDYIARMDADDVALPYRFQVQADLLARGFDIVGGGITLFNSNGQLKDIRYPSSRCGVLYSLLCNNPIAHPLAMYKKDAFNRLQGYRMVDYAEDLDLWMRAYLAGYKISNSARVLLLRRMHEAQLSSLYTREQEHSTKVLRKNFIRKLYTTRFSAAAGSP